MRTGLPRNSTAVPSPKRDHPLIVCYHTPPLCSRTCTHTHAYTLSHTRKRTRARAHTHRTQAFSTLCTVGYGDISPASNVEKIFAMFAMYVCTLFVRGGRGVVWCGERVRVRVCKNGSASVWVGGSEVCNHAANAEISTRCCSTRTPSWTGLGGLGGATGWLAGWLAGSRPCVHHTVVCAHAQH